MNDSAFEPQRPTRFLSLPLHQPFFTYPLVVIIGLIWLAMEFMLGGSTNTRALVIYGANVGQLIMEGEIWRFFTSMFLHIGLAHLLFNGYALLIFGTEIEHLYGGPRFLTIYVLSGLFGSLTSFASHGPQVLSAGASGAIFGLIGTNLAFFWFHKDKLGSYGKQQLSNTLFIIGINLVFGFMVPAVDNMAHLGGLVAGVMIGLGLAPQYHIVHEDSDYDAHLEDTVSLANRWWVVAMAIVVLYGSTQLAINFYQG